MKTQIKGRIITVAGFLAAAAVLLPTSNAVGTEIDLTSPYPGSGSFPSATFPGPGGSGVIYSTIDTLPAGTGVFDPFLTYQNKGTEEGYNTSQGGNGQGYLDDKRVPQWTHDLHVGDLAVIPGPNGAGSYYAFELDANETGNGTDNRLLSIDNIRIYTSPTDTANSVGNAQNISQLNGLGTLRYAQNTGTGTHSYDNWVLIDASRSEGGQTSGSGSSDMIVYVPTALFAGALPADYLYFYTLNGYHDPAADGSSSDAGYEEWRAVVNISVPDGGSTLVLLGVSLTALWFLIGRHDMAGNA